MEEKSLEKGEARVKFQCKRVGSITELLDNDKKKKIYNNNARQLADALLNQEDHGLSPVLPDGKIGGNGAATVKLDNKNYLLVSKSGKSPGEMDLLKSMCLVQNFDKEKWSCEYYSESEDIQPTSDTPMHYCILHLQCIFEDEMEEYPQVALHGHALATVEEADKLDFPYSKETMCSTPEDTEVMIDMLKKHTYPEHKVFIRLNHGYYLLGKDYEECVKILENKIVAHL